MGSKSIKLISPSWSHTEAVSFHLIRRRIRRLAKDASSTLRSGNLTEQRNILRTWLRAWESLLPVYMPGLVHYQVTGGDSTSSTTSQFSTATSDPTRAAPQNSPNPEDTDIWLPSRIRLLHRSRVCQPGLAEIEERIRTAQCFDALEAVRHVLRIKTRMVEFKNRHARGQREGLRSRTVIDRVHERARQAAEKYRVARAAKLELSGPGDWENALRVLKDEDVRGYQDPNRLRIRNGHPGTLEDDQVTAEEHSSNTSPETTSATSGFSLYNEIRDKRDGTGETRRTLSWIWTTQPPNRDGEADDETDDILRVEWAKSRARMNRCKEEVMLLKEEMRRVKEFLDWKVRWWRDREECRKDVDGAVLEGLRGYGRKQAILQNSLAQEFLRIWESVRSATQQSPENQDDGGSDLEEDDDDDPDEGAEDEDRMDDDDSDNDNDNEP